MDGCHLPNYGLQWHTSNVVSWFQCEIYWKKNLEFVLRFFRSLTTIPHIEDPIPWLKPSPRRWLFQLQNLHTSIVSIYIQDLKTEVKYDLIHGRAKSNFSCRDCSAEWRDQDHRALPTDTILGLYSPPTTPNGNKSPKPLNEPSQVNALLTKISQLSFTNTQNIICHVQ